MARKAAKNTARGHVRQRGSTWSVVLTVRDPATGLPSRKWYSGYKDAEEAEKKRTELLKALDEHTWVDPATVTVAAYFRAWLDARRADPEAPLAEKTAQRYQDFIERFIVPGLGGLRLQRLGPVTLRTFYANAQAGTLALPAAGPDEPTPRARRPLAPRTVRHLRAFVQQVLDEAVDDRTLARNPSPRARRRKTGQGRRVANGGAFPLDEAGAARLVAAARGHDLEPLLVVALNTGLRRGELLALRWADVDLDRATLTVARSLEVVRGPKAPDRPREVYAIKDPKTPDSVRTLTLPRLAVETLRAHRTAQKRQRVHAGPAWTTDPAYADLVFTRDDGRPLNPTWTSKAVTRLAKSAGLAAGVTLHTCRHAHGSILLAAGVPLPEVSRRLGHANPAITAAIYSHALKRQDSAAAAMLDAAFRAAGMTAPAREPVAGTAQ